MSGGGGMCVLDRERRSLAAERAGGVGGQGGGPVRVLVIEDEVMPAEALQSGLRRAAMAVDIVHDGDAALESLAVTEYDAAVLDRDLPGIHGDRLCKLIVENHPTCRILMLTAARRPGEKVAGPELGADDYLTKPFEFPEPVARLHALNPSTVAEGAPPATSPAQPRSGTRTRFGHRHSTPGGSGAERRFRWRPDRWHHPAPGTATSQAHGLIGSRRRSSREAAAGRRTTRTRSGVGLIRRTGPRPHRPSRRVRRRRSPRPPRPLRRHRCSVPRPERRRPTAGPGRTSPGPSSG